MYNACNKSACLTLYILVAKTLKILKQILVYLVSLLHFTISNSKDIVSQNFLEASKIGNLVFIIYFSLPGFTRGVSRHQNRDYGRRHSTWREESPHYEPQDKA